MNIQLNNELYINTYNLNANIKFEDNKAIIVYNQYILEHIIFDEEKNVG